MKELFAENFFDLSSYSHAKIFKEQKFVWEALNAITHYLSFLKLGKIECNIPEHVFLVDKHLISIGKGSIVEEGAYIKGPCCIGENCTIRHGAYIRGDVIIGNDCVIGHDTEIKQSILLNHANAAHFAYLGNTILGNHVNLGAGTKCANLRFDKKNIAIFFQNQKIITGMHKFGAIIGDYSQTGCNVVTSPGTILGKSVVCSPALNIKGLIPANSFIKCKQELLVEPYNLK